MRVQLKQNIHIVFVRVDSVRDKWDEYSKEHRVRGEGQPDQYVSAVVVRKLLVRERGVHRRQLQQFQSDIPSHVQLGSDVGGHEAAILVHRALVAHQPAGRGLEHEHQQPEREQWGYFAHGYAAV